MRARTKRLLDDYAGDALDAGRYDFHMGRRLSGHLERSEFTGSKVLTVEDQELSLRGPAHPAVVEAWRARFDRMKPLKAFCGSEFESVREEFLDCLAQTDHWSRAKMHSCLAF